MENLIDDIVITEDNNNLIPDFGILLFFDYFEKIIKIMHKTKLKYFRKIN